MSRASIFHEERCMLRDLRSRCNNDEDFFNEVADIIGPLRQDQKNLEFYKEKCRVLVAGKIEDIVNWCRK